MRVFLAVLVLLFLYGCQHQEEEVMGFEFAYLLMDADNKTTEGPVDGSITFRRDSTYFHIRANITSKDNVTHYLKVLDQRADAYGIRLPIYCEEHVNGFERKWTDITGIEEGNESTVQLGPGEAVELEQPVFFFNQQVSRSIPSEMTLEIAIVNASGRTLGKTSIRITIRD
ncbi:MAG: hypothetical protein ABIG39_03295 [Candidatus Micrarchaeota archaeon]